MVRRHVRFNLNTIVEMSKRTALDYHLKLIDDSIIDLIDELQININNDTVDLFVLYRRYRMCNYYINYKRLSFGNWFLGRR